MRRPPCAGIGKLGSLRCAGALLLAGLVPAWAGPKEDGDAAFKAGKMAEAEVTGTLKADPNCRDPKALTEAENKLRAQGFSNLGDFMNKLGSQFEAFKNR